MKMSNTSKMMLVIIGVIIGALIFSQFNPSTRPEAVSSENAAPSFQSDTLDDIIQRPVMNLKDFNQAFVEIAKKVNPTVVTVFTEKVFKVRRGFEDPFFFSNPFEDFFNEFFGRPYTPQQPKEEEYRQQGLGSGVIVSKNGYILTNNHVVADADTIYVRLIDKRTVPAKVIGADAKTDIAVLKIDEKNLPAIRLGDSDKLQVGEWVLAIGSPMSPNLEHTVTAGIVSAKGRSNVGLADYEDFIQTDAAINPGNSGGALVNLDGELVGINTAIATRSGGFQGIGFAVPINMAKQVMESLIKHGTVIRGWLGVYIQNVDQTMAKAMDLPTTKGALVSDVTKDSPAEKAGIKKGDFITEMNGKQIENVTDLRNRVASSAPGTKVKFKIIRNGKEKTISLKLGKLEANKVAPETKNKLVKLFGFKVEAFNEKFAVKYGLDKSLKGVIVTDIKRGSSAYRAGLKEGDLIVSVNRHAIDDIEAFNNFVNDLKKGDTVLFQIVRKNRYFFIAFQL